MTRRKAIGRMKATFTVPLTIVAWFLLSNHCALGVIASPTEAAPETTGCPMHSAPAKKKPAAKTPCCKEVRAVLAKCVKNATPFPLRFVGSCDYGTKVFGPSPRVTIEIDGLDTGPRGSVSFAELVLQESMLAHAPPVS